MTIVVWEWLCRPREQVEESCGVEHSSFEFDISDQHDREARDTIYDTIDLSRIPGYFAERTLDRVDGAELSADIVESIRDAGYGAIDLSCILGYHAEWRLDCVWLA